MRSHIAVTLILALQTSLFAAEQTVKGKIKFIDTTKNSITLDDLELDVTRKTKITVDGKKATLDDIKSGQDAKVVYDDSLDAAISITAGTADAASTGDKSPPDDAMEFKGHFYKFFPEVLQWHRAKRRCEDMGGHLATISNKEEGSFVLNLAKKQIKPLGKMDGFWLGATDEELEGEWKWVDGSPFKYTKWHDGQPNNKKDFEHYLLHWISGDAWVDQPALSEQHPAYFVCEWESTKGDPGTDFKKPSK